MLRKLLKPKKGYKKLNVLRGLLKRRWQNKWKLNAVSELQKSRRRLNVLRGLLKKNGQKK